jgi:uncharacterized membrane protein
MLKNAKIAARLIFWLITIGFTLLLLVNAFPYFTFNPEYSMLGEKPISIKSPLYFTLFYIHVASGLLCLTLGPVMFIQKLIGNGIHKKLGKLFAYNVFVLVPTGIYLSLYAKGGITSTFSFSLLGVLMVICMLKGIQQIRKGNIKKHTEWMTRNYALAASALTFRIFHIALLYFSTDYIEVYLASVNLSLVANLLIAELIIESKRRTFIKSKLSWEELRSLEH